MLKIGAKVKYKDWSDKFEGTLLEMNLATLGRTVAKVKILNLETNKGYTDYFYLDDLIEILDYDESWI